MQIYFSSNENIFIECKYIFYRLEMFLSNANIFLTNFATFRQPYQSSLALHVLAEIPAPLNNGERLEHVPAKQQVTCVSYDNQQSSNGFN